MISGAVVGCIVAWYALVLGTTTVGMHRDYRSYGFDLGIYDQGLWLLSRFHEPFVTVMGRNLFGDHSSIMLLPLVPFYALGAGPNFLVIIQTLALAATAIPVYLIGRHFLPQPWMAVLASTTVLLYPTLAWTNLEQFHPDALAAPVLAGAVLAMLNDKWRWFVACCVVLCLIKEDMVLVVAPLGVMCALFHNRRVGWSVVAGSVAWTILALISLRWLNGVGSLNSWRIPFGGFGGLLRTTFTDPLEVARYLVSGGRGFYVVQLVVPVAGLAFLAPRFAVLGALVLASNLVSTFYYQHDIKYHYSLLFAPIMVIAAIAAVGKLRRSDAQAGAVVALVVCSLYGAYLWGPLPFAREPWPTVTIPAGERSDVNQALAAIPSGANLAVPYRFLTQLSHRAEIYEIPTPFAAQNWGTFDQEGKPLTDRIARLQYVLIDHTLTPAQQEAWARYRDQFEVVLANPTLTLYRRAP